MANLDEKDFQEKMIEGMEFAEEQRELQMDVSKEIRDNTDVSAEATMENTEVLKKYEVVFGRMAMTNIMQASFMESMSLVMHEVRDIQKRQLDLEIEKMRDAAREEKVTEHEEAAPPAQRTDEDDNADHKKPNLNTTSFLNAFLPGLGTFFGTLFGGSGLLAVLGKGALAGLAVTVLSPVREFVVGAVEGALEGFEVSDETFNTIAPQLDNAVRNGMIAAFLGPKRAAVGTAIGSIISGAVFDFFDEDGDSVIKFAGIEMSKETAQNIGSAIGFALGAFLPILIKKALPAVLSAIGLSTVVGGAVRGAAVSALGGLKSAATRAAPSLLSGAKSAASTAGSVIKNVGKGFARAGGPLAFVTGMLAMSNPEENQGLDVGMPELPENATPEEFTAYQMEVKQRAAAIKPNMEAIQAESDAAQEMMDQIRAAEEARIEEVRKSRMMALEDLAMSSFVAPRMTDEEARAEGARTAEIDTEQARNIEVMLERNARDASKIATIEKGQAAQNNVLSAPMTVGPRTTVTNNNTTNNFNTQTDPSRSLSTRPSFLPQ